MDRFPSLISDPELDPKGGSEPAFFPVQLNWTASGPGRGVPTVLCPNCHTLVKVPTDFIFYRCSRCLVFLREGPAAETTVYAPLTPTDEEPPKDAETPVYAPLTPTDEEPPKDEKTVGFISSFFKKNRQINFFRRAPKYEEKLAPPPSSDLTEQSVEEEHHAMRFGLASVFPYEELKEATNRFNESQVLGGGGFGRVYLGKFTDGRTVKVLKECKPKRMEEFYKVVSSHSSFRHQNLVTLYGCPGKRDEELLLVYELLPNGTLADHLHGKRVTKEALTFDVRIQIAIDTAQALAYLQSFNPPVVHGRVKTDTILLDNNFNAKVVDLGLCHLLPTDKQIAINLGLRHFLPTENEQHNKLSAKWDVYSFGVVLMELISGNHAVDVNRECDEIHATSLHKKLKLLVDNKLPYVRNSEIRWLVSSMAQLAFRCLQPNENKRPHMEEVLRILKCISEQQTILKRTSKQSSQSPTQQRTSKQSSQSPTQRDIGQSWLAE